MPEAAKISNQPEEIPDVAKEKLTILKDVPDEIRIILLEAEKTEKAQLSIKDPVKRAEMIKDALYEYQKGLDKVRVEAKKNARLGFAKEQDKFVAEEIYITQRMNYLDGILHKLPKQVH